MQEKYSSLQIQSSKEGAFIFAGVSTNRRALHKMAKSLTQKPGIFHALRMQNYFNGKKHHHILCFYQKPQHMVVDF